ncbi:proteasome regulatory particle base subunit [Coemansia sp. RSA 1200]|nr:proteasome regulatory particle base subunit [Coemansia sp. RSA 1200]
MKSDRVGIGRTGTLVLWIVALLACISAVGGELVVKNVNVRVLERTGDKIFDQMLNKPGVLEGVPKLSSTTPLSITFDVETDNKAAAELDQAFVSLRNPTTGNEVGVVAKKTKRGSYRMDLTRKTFRTHFSGSPGTYNAALVLGSFSNGGVFYGLGDIRIAGAGKKKRQEEQGASRYGPKPEIHHQFAEAQKTGSAVVSLAFTALVAAPLAGLVGAWIRLGVNGANLKKEAAGSVAFVGLVAAYVVLAGAYWVGVKLFPTLAYALVLAPPTYLAGQYALSRRIQENIDSSRQQT